jgi:hypothetical protein
MKKLVLCLILLISITAINAQNFTINTDSVYTTRQYDVMGATVEDTTATITLTNTTSNPLNLKVSLLYEDLTYPDFAMVQYFADSFMHDLNSDYGVGSTDSLVLMGNDTVGFTTVFIGEMSLPIHEIELVVYEPSDSINTFKVLSFVLINCQASSTIIVNPTGAYCSADSVDLNVVSGFEAYEWSTGDTSQTIRVLASDEIYIEATDDLGCISKDTADISVRVPHDEEICIVSVDSATGKNVIVWEKTTGVGTEQFYIYKESFQAGVYNLIGFVNYDSLSVFIDVNSNPLQQSVKYKITAVDSCGTESDKSTYHKTIHLTASIGTGNENNLVWDDYEGFSFLTYNIYRGATPNNMTLLAQLASTNFTYSDLNPLTGNNYYKVEAVRNSSCSPTQKAITYLSSVSNQVNLNPLGINDVAANQVSIYPNPMEDVLMIDLGRTYKNITIAVKNVLGSTVLTETYKNSDKLELNQNLKKGIYFIDVNVDGNHLTTKKVVKK